MLTNSGLDFIVNHWELLQSGDNNALSIVNGITQSARVFLLVNRNHTSQSMVKAGNGGLQLLIENTAVCNNDYAVKNCIVVFVVEAGHTVSRPSDRIRFAGTGTVLDEIVMSSAISSNMIDQLTHDIQLVIPWENDFAADGFLCGTIRQSLLFFCSLVVNELLQNIQQAILLEDFLPEV